MSPRAGLDTQTLVLAAAELADEYGMEGVTLALLAAKLGVRSPSLYNHVNGLKELRIRWQYTDCSCFMLTCQPQ